MEDGAEVVARVEESAGLAIESPSPAVDDDVFVTSVRRSASVLMSVGRGESDPEDVG